MPNDGSMSPVAYSQRFLIRASRMSMGPVAEIMFKGWPEKSENKMPQTEDARMHSVVAFGHEWRQINRRKRKKGRLSRRYYH